MEKRRLEFTTMILMILVKVWDNMIINLMVFEMYEKFL